MPVKGMLIALVIMLLTLAACAGQTQQPNFQATIDAAVVATQSASRSDVSITATTSSSAIPASATPPATKPSSGGLALCEAEKWTFVPTKVLVQPAPQGWKYVLAYVAAINNSQYWGNPANAYHTWETSSLVTEGGFKYTAIRETYLSFEPPFAGSTGSRVPPFNGYIPPSFVASGKQDNVTEQLQLLFQVAENQNEYTITIPFVEIECTYTGADQHYETSRTPITLDLTKSYNSTVLPTTNTELPSITEPIQIPGSGILQYLGTTQGEDRLQLRFKVTNPSSGYGASGIIQGYLLGDDGMLHHSCDLGRGAGFSLGPGETTEIQLCYLAPNGVGNWHWALSAVDTERNVLMRGVYVMP